MSAAGARADDSVGDVRAATTRPRAASQAGITGSQAVSARLPSRARPPSRRYSIRRSAVSAPGESPVFTVTLGSMSTISAPSLDTGWCRTPRGTT